MKKIKVHWLLGNPASSIRVKILRWIARVWSLLIFAFALAVALDQNYSTIKTREKFMLSLWMVAFLGLLLAWRFERLGALITIIIMPVREVLYFLIYREWTINFLLIWAMVLPPAVMYLLAWSSDRNSEVRT